jgi:hypothetical protein
LVPDLPENAIRAALGVKDEELLLVHEDGVETVARDVFQRLHRASLRRLVREVSA